MNNYFETMNNCRDYIRNNPNVKEGYENLDGSNCSGFEYTLHNSMAVKLRVDKKIDFAIMEVYPGITVRGVHQSMVAEYCQRVSECPGAGYLAVDVDQGNVYFHCETSFRDNPVTSKLLKMMEDAAIALLDKHIPIIDCLAYGRLPNSPFPLMEEPIENTAVVGSADEQNLLDMNIEEIRRHLTNSGHNVAAENLNPDSPIRYFLETISGNMRYREYIRIMQNGWMFRTVRLDTKCGEAYRSQLAQYCNEASDEKKVGFLKIGSDGYPYCTVATYLLGDELISKKTLEEMVSIAATFLKNSEEKLLYIGHGVLPPKSEDHDDVMSSIAKGVLGRMGGRPPMRERDRTGDSSPTSLLDLFTSLKSDDESDGDSMRDLMGMLDPDEDDDDELNF